MPTRGCQHAFVTSEMVRTIGNGKGKKIPTRCAEEMARFGFSSKEKEFISQGL